MKKILIVPDAHWPFHCKQSWNLLCTVAKKFRPDIVINLGDCYDFNAVKSHRRLAKKEKDRELLGMELARVAQARLDMEGFGATTNIFIEGNHCDRLSRYIDDNAPMLADLVDVKQLLGYDNGKWTWVSYGDYIKIGKCYYTHDVGFSGANAIHRSESAFEGNVVIGHTHRIDYNIKGNAIGKPHAAASFGWLGDPKQIDYMHTVKINREWSHGFGIGYMTDAGVTHLQPVPIIQGRCIVEGKLYGV